MISQKLKPAKAWDGEDRHNGEIASFHLNRILKFNRAPLVAGRKINLTDEILPVATARLKKTFENYQNNTCFYGECHYCKPSYRACAKVRTRAHRASTAHFPAALMHYFRVI